jgi:hypothetical protein
MQLTDDQILALDEYFKTYQDSPHAPTPERDAIYLIRKHAARIRTQRAEQ